MGAKELNELLLKNFPNLKRKFESETEWQDGIDTGSVVVFEDVFFKYLKRNINRDEIAKKIFTFIKNLLELHDEYVTNVVSVAIIENIVSLPKKEKYVKYFDDNMKNIANNIGIEYYYNWKDIK